MTIDKFVSVERKSEAGWWLDLGGLRCWSYPWLEVVNEAKPWV
jgi:hypothetical protein